MASNGTNGTKPPEMTEDEIALYDRQIRLWGMGAQEKLRLAHVLVINMRGLGNEIAKNLVLAGIGSLTISDSHVVTEADLGAQFLLATPSATPDVVGPDASLTERRAADWAASKAAVGRNRGEAASEQLRALNPRVAIHVDAARIESKDVSWFKQFTAVVATDLPSKTLGLINTITRFADCPLYAASTYGLFGFIFADLIEHDFTIVRDRSNAPLAAGAHETRTRSIVGVAAGTDADAGRETVTKRELYSTWYLAADAAPLPASIRNSPRRLRNVSPVLACLRALWAFQETHVDGAVPDAAEFATLVAEKQQALGTPAVPQAVMDTFLAGVGMGELAPVVSVLGGQLAQDVINALGHTQQPIQNLAVFDASTMQSLVYALHPDGQLGRHLLKTAPQVATAAGAAAAVAASDSVLGTAQVGSPAVATAVAMTTGASVPSLSTYNGALAALESAADA